MVRKSSPLLAENRPKERTRDHFSLRPDAGKARDTPRLATRIDNSHAQRSTSEAVFQIAKGVLLRIGGNCSLFTSEPAHISGHLPLETYGATRAPASSAFPHPIAVSTVSSRAFFPPFCISTCPPEPAHVTRVGRELRRAPQASRCLRPPPDLEPHVGHVALTSCSPHMWPRRRWQRC
jgi:hypothetical protein